MTSPRTTKMPSTQILIEEDCTVLLERALLRKTLCAFGEDGFGQHGKKDTPSFFDVVDLRIDIHVDDTQMPRTVSGVVSICLRGYDHRDVGHIKTDKNFDISLAQALCDAGITKNPLQWAEIDEQIDGCVTFYLDVGELLDWH